MQLSILIYFSILILLGTTIRTTWTQSPPTMSPTYVANCSFTFTDGRTAPGASYYNLNENKMLTYWDDGDNDVAFELQIYNTSSGYIYWINEYTNGTTLCSPMPVFGPFSVDQWSWLQDGAINKGKVTIRNITCDFWYGPGIEDFWLYVEENTNIPVRFIYGYQGAKVTQDFLTYSPKTPNDTVFDVPEACLNSTVISEPPH